MKKHSTVKNSVKPTKPTKQGVAKQSPKRLQVGAQDRITIGVDLGDKHSRYCVLNAAGEVMAEERVATAQTALAGTFGALRPCRIVMEVGTHSPWVSRLLSSFGHEVIVANARQLRLISASSRKDDRMDAEMLARLGRMDPKLLRPIQHRGERAQQHLAVIRMRAALVQARTALVNSARGLTKSLGERLPSCDADSLSVKRLDGLTEKTRDLLTPFVEEIESLTKKIHKLDGHLEQIARDEYPETKLLRQIHGVGPLIALTFVLTLEDKDRFEKSRDVGCYVGLRPRRGDSGESQPQLRITKEGDDYLRSLLVQGAQCILGKRAPDTDLKRFGLKLCQRGGKKAKKRATVAVARKLSVLLHHLWVSGDVYDPLYNSKAKAKAPRGKKPKMAAA